LSYRNGCSFESDNPNSITYRHLPCRKIAIRVGSQKQIDIKNKTFEEKTLREIDLTNTLNCQVIAVRKHNEPNYRYIPKADDTLFKGDIAILIGTKKSLSKINP
jgi:uncharacterized protein with PhoU and TrkA domain